MGQRGGGGGVYENYAPTARMSHGRDERLENTLLPDVESEHAKWRSSLVMGDGGREEKPENQIENRLPPWIRFQNWLHY